MDFDQLRAFVSIAQTKNFTKASQQLHVAQSTITTRIKALEASVGHQLFERTKRSVELTLAGRLFLPYAERILALSEESRLVIEALTQNKKRLVVAGSSSLWTYIFYAHVQSFRERHPDVVLQILSGHTSKEVIQYLVDGVVDVAVVYNPPQDSKIEVEEIMEEDLLLVGHPSFGPVVSREDFWGDKYIHIHWSQQFLDWFEANVGPGFVPSFRINQSAYMLRLLLEGYGFGFMFRSIVQPYLDKGELAVMESPFSTPPPTGKVHVIYLSSRKNHPNTRLGFDLLQLKRRPENKG
jgi:DNA-binding transcriptional LysR family regulator